MESLIIPNLFVCLIGGYLCICRMRFISSETKKPIMLRYVMWFTAFAASGLSWLFGFPPSLFQIIMALCVIGDFGLGFKAWRYGPPQYSKVTNAG